MGINLYFFNVLQFVVFFSQMQTQTLTLLFIDDVTGMIPRFSPTKTDGRGGGEIISVIVDPSHREWRSWRLPARTWKWEGKTPPSVLTPPTTQNSRLMGKYPPSQRRRRISNWPPHRLTELPVISTTVPVGGNYGKNRHCTPLCKTRNGEKKYDLEVLILFCKKEKDKSPMMI